MLVRGIGDIGSAVAHLLCREGYEVVIHDVPLPNCTRRRMAFADAIFDGEATLEGVRAMRIDLLSGFGSAGPRKQPAVSIHDFDALLETYRPDILVDARMRKQQLPEGQMHLAQYTIGLGPNFIAGETTHSVIETAWGESLGDVITHGYALPKEGGPRVIGGYGIERVVYAPESATFSSDHAIGDKVFAGEVVAHLGSRPLTVTLDGRLRGLTHNSVPVQTGTKVIEVDPRGDDAVVTGIGERPARIAAGVLRALSGSTIKD